MICTRFGVIGGSTGSAGGSGPYTDGTYYYVFVNKVNPWWERINNYIGNPSYPPAFSNRWWADNLSYDLYEKPDGNNQTGWKNIYTYLTSSLNPNGNVTFNNVLYVEKPQGRGTWLTTVDVTVANGYPTFSFPNGGTTIYNWNIQEDRGGPNFYTASLINGGWIP